MNTTHSWQPCDFSSHQMSVPGEVLKWSSFNRSSVLATRCHFQGVPVQWGPSWTSLCSEVGGEGVRAMGIRVQCSDTQCIMSNGHMGAPPTPMNIPTDRYRRLKTLPFRNLRWRAVIKLTDMYRRAGGGGGAFINLKHAEPLLIQNVLWMSYSSNKGLFGHRCHYQGQFVVNDQML